MDKLLTITSIDFIEQLKPFASSLTITPLCVTKRAGNLIQFCVTPIGKSPLQHFIDYSSLDPNKVFIHLKMKHCKPKAIALSIGANNRVDIQYYLLNGWYQGKPPNRRYFYPVDELALEKTKELNIYQTIKVTRITHKRGKRLIIHHDNYKLYEEKIPKSLLTTAIQTVIKSNERPSGYAAHDPSSYYGNFCVDLQSNNMMIDDHRYWKAIIQ